jgi:SAM-dependent methyltransferase
MERAVYDRMARIDGEHWWFAARRDIIATLIAARIAKGRQLRILEVGCGTGANLGTLQQFGTVDAVEPDDAARAVAATRSGVAVKGGYLPGVELADGAYDAIVMFDVLEHIPQDEEALAALRTKLAPGGRLMITVPANPWLWSGHDAQHHHHRRYTRKSLHAVMSLAGFAPQHVSYFNTLLFPVVVLRRAIGKLTGRESNDDVIPAPPVNRLLRAVFGAERWWLSRRSLPFGVSLLAISQPA